MKPNLDKPFSVEAFEEGKQYCTRDGVLLPDLSLEPSHNGCYMLRGRIGTLMVTWVIEGNVITARDYCPELFEAE